MERLKLSSNEKEEFLEKIKEKLDNCKRLSDFHISINEYTKLDTTNIKKPVIQIPTDVYFKMFEYVRQSETEIQWHGLVHQDKENQIYIIYDVFLFPQINSAAATNTNTQAFGDWIESKIIDFEFPYEDMRLHGHSHVNMTVFSSSIDDGYQKDILTKVEDGDYYLFLVLNKKHDICALLYDLDQRIFFENKDIIIQILDTKGNELRTEVAQEIKNNCTTAPRTVYKTGKASRNFTTDNLDMFNDYPILGGKNYGFK